MDDPLINLALLRHLDPDFFTACGRALYVAQHFEKNLRSIAASLDLRAAHRPGELPRADEDKLNEFYNARLNRPLGRAIHDGLPDHLPPVLVEHFEKHMLPPLDAAREARNRIAHEFLFGIEGVEVPSHVFEEMATDLRQHVRTLAAADYSVCCIIQGFNDAPVPTCRQHYVDEIVRWVMSPLKEHLHEAQ